MPTEWTQQKTEPTQSQRAAKDRRLNFQAMFTQSIQFQIELTQIGSQSTQRISEPIQSQKIDSDKNMIFWIKSAEPIKRSTELTQQETESTQRRLSQSNDCNDQFFRTLAFCLQALPMASFSLPMARALNVSISNDLKW